MHKQIMIPGKFSILSYIPKYINLQDFSMFYEVRNWNSDTKMYSRVCP